MYSTQSIDNYSIHKMPCKYRRICPVCGKENLKYLADHLRQVHAMNSSERLPWLRSAKYQGIKVYALHEEPVNKKVNTSHSNDERLPETRACDQGQSNEFYMEKILETREVKGKTIYLIKWKGWDATYNTWVDRIPNTSC